MSVLSHAQYDAMLESHRRAPGNISEAARCAGVSRATASKYYKHGGDEAWMLPIYKTIEREREAARARLASETVDTRVEAEKERAAELGRIDAELARIDVGAELLETAKLSRQAKSNAKELLGIIGRMLEGCKTIERELADAFKSGHIRELVKSKPAEAIRLVRELARLVHDGNLAGETASKLEARLLGHEGDGTQPGGVHIHVESVDDARRIIDRAHRAAVRAGLAAPVPAGLPPGQTSH